MANDPSTGPESIEVVNPDGSRLTSSPPTGFKTASLVLMGVGGAAFALGLLPCLGWLNWAGVPLNGLAVLAGLGGLKMGPRRLDGTLAYQGSYAAAVIVGAIGLVGGAIRCLGGGGIF